jgi:hypothetical protein
LEDILYCQGERDEDERCGYSSGHDMRRYNWYLCGTVLRCMMV